MARIEAARSGEVTGSTNFTIDETLSVLGSIINPSGSLILSSSDSQVYVSGNFYINGLLVSSGSINLINLGDVDNTDIPAKNDVVMWNGSKFVFVSYSSSFVFSISSFASNAGATTFEIGTGTWKSVSSLSFTAVYNNGPATNGYVAHSGWVSNLTLTNVYQGPTTNVESVVYPSVGGTRSFVLTATDGSTVATSTLTYYFYNRRFWGISSKASGYNESDVESLANNELSNSRSKTFTVTAASGEYIIYAYPFRLGVATFTVGGFEGGFEPPETVSIINASGYTENYYVYRSTNSNLGLTTVVVT